MSSLLERIFGHEHKSANQAKERLKTGPDPRSHRSAPGMLESLKDELIKVISRYVRSIPRLCESTWSRMAANSG